MKLGISSQVARRIYVGRNVFKLAVQLFSTGLVIVLLSATQGCTPPDSHRKVAPGPHDRPDATKRGGQPRETPRTHEIERVRRVNLGRSVKGAELTMEVFGDGPDRIFIFGGIHGSEPTSAWVARALADHLRVHWEAFEGKTIAVLAEANPDGLAAGTRENAHGVDLNRNFPAKNWTKAKNKPKQNGHAPGSEPETRAIMQAIETICPSRIVSIHSIRQGKHCNNYDGPAGPLARLMGGHNGYMVTPTMGYPTPGSFGSYAGVDRGIPTITLELPRRQNGPKSWVENRAALLAFIRGQ